MLIFIPLFLEKFLFSHTKNMFKHYPFVFCSSLGINYFPGDSGSFEWVRISRKQYLNLSVLGASVFVFSVLSEAIVRKYTYTHSTSLICKSFLNPFIYILKIMSSHQHLQSQLNFTRFMLHFCLNSSNMLNWPLLFQVFYVLEDPIFKNQNTIQKL